MQRTPSMPNMHSPSPPVIPTSFSLDRTTGAIEIYACELCAASRVLTTQILVFETVDMLRITHDVQYCSASWGLPVVAFDAGGISEWLVSGYNGFLAPWMDRGEFAARVE